MEFFFLEQEFPNFSVEMETGTGKTYVYVSTALRLAAGCMGCEVHPWFTRRVRWAWSKTFEQTEERRLKYPASRTSGVCRGRTRH